MLAQPRTVIAVLLGGAIGTGLRLALDAGLGHPGGLPWVTLGINVMGSFALGALVSLAWRRAPEWLRAGLGAGLLGSFTTFSAVAVAVVGLGQSSDWMTALGYLVATLVLGLAAALLGLSLGRGRGATGKLRE